jgi:hypothetical protein
MGKGASMSAPNPKIGEISKAIDAFEVAVRKDMANCKDNRIIFENKWEVHDKREILINLIREVTQ